MTLSDQDVAGRRAPTMREVAALAQVSFKTVSRVINREPTVSPENASRVHDAVRLLDYRPNMAAVSLRRTDRRTSTIGLLLEDVANPFSSALHRAVEDTARRQGTLVFAGSSDADPEREQELLAAFLSHQVDGLIVVPSGRDHSGLLSERGRVGTPVIFVDRPAAHLVADSVTADNRGGAREAVAHLAAYGHRRIAFLGDLRSIWTAAERHVGYVEGLAAAGIPYHPQLVRQDFQTIEAAEGAALDLLGSASPPTAFFTGQNLITLGAIRALRQHGLQHRVALVGFDDLLIADLLEPAVSIIAQDPATLGRRAAQLLFARLSGDHSPAQHVVVPTRLVPRGSGEIPAR
jgi:LacI family transcriptional regulator